MMQDSYTAQSSPLIKVAIAGASGFVGKSLCAQLSKHCAVAALTRRADLPFDEKLNQLETPGVSWRKCNLFSLLETEIAVFGCDVGIYLVHSMLPTARLVQGRFDDIDVILADNFARASKKMGLKRILFLGGIIPNANLSRHLRSRLEVEEALAAHDVPVTTLRCGLIIGPNGSSFRIMERLVRRLPVMVCPKWTGTLGQPVSLQDTVNVMEKLVFDTDLEPKAYDLGGPDRLSYVEMMQRMAKRLGLKRFFFKVKFVSPKLSRLWVTTITGSPKQLVAPLIQSLKHPMLARDQFLFHRYRIEPLTFDQAIDVAMLHGKKVKDRISDMGRDHLKRRNDVCSIQRLPMPQQHDLVWVTKAYTRWVQGFLRPLIYTHFTEDGSFAFRIHLLPRMLGTWVPYINLLDLKFSQARSSDSRRLFYIEGGLLWHRGKDLKARLEFRLVLQRRFVMISVFDFEPSLPWWVYKYTQAILHLMVMRGFAGYLKRVDAGR